MLSLLALTLFAQCGPEGPVFSCPPTATAPTPPPPTGPLFQFASTTTDAGMSAPCACAPVTGTKGEAMTFTRASTAYCMKGNTLTGIANGDVVECAADQPVIMPGGDGTGGVGLAVWPTLTNTALRSQEFENAIWVKASNSGVYPIVTANQAIAPDGTMTADRIQVPATASNQYSQIWQNAFQQVPSMKSLFVKGVSGSGTLRMCSDSNNCSNCDFISTSWMRCTQTPTNFVYSQYVYIGNSVSASGLSAVDAYIWQMDNYSGIEHLPPPIKTAGTAATRALDDAFFAVDSGGAPEVSVSFKGVPAMPVVANSHPFAWLGTNQAHDSILGMIGPTASHCYYRIGGTQEVLTNSTTFGAGHTDFSCSYDLVNRRKCVNGACITAASSYVLPEYKTLEVGSYLGAFRGILKNVCADTTATGCAP